MTILTLFPYTAYRKVWWMVYTKRVESLSIKQVGKGTSNKASTINKKSYFFKTIFLRDLFLPSGSFRTRRLDKGSLKNKCGLIFFLKSHEIYIFWNIWRVVLNFLLQMSLVGNSMIYGPAKLLKTLKTPTCYTAAKVLNLR